MGPSWNLFIQILSVFPLRYGIPAIFSLVLFLIVTRYIKKAYVVYLGIIISSLIGGGIIDLYHYVTRPILGKTVSANQSQSSVTSFPDKKREDSDISCEGWSACSDFKTDTSLENGYYIHSGSDPQILILDNDIFPNPAIYLNEDVPAYFDLKIDAQPLNIIAGNILIEGKELFQLFIGDGDYRSLGFLYWNNKQRKWERRDDNKIFLGRDLNKPDIEPMTVIGLEVISTRSKNNNALLKFTLNYKSIKGKIENAKFEKIIELPSANPDSIKTKLGVGIYGKRTEAQVKFISIRVRE